MDFISHYATTSHMVQGPITSRRVLLASLTILPLTAIANQAKGRSSTLGDDFRNGLDRWIVEAQEPARVSAKDGILDIDTPEGITLWFEEQLTGPVAIDYDVLAVSEGGPQDAVSDVNAFWMAGETDGSAILRKRSGTFADYDDIKTYYVGIGGNRNSTTRFRRYVGKPGKRPLLPEHDRSEAAALLQPNRWMHIRLIANGERIAVERDGRTLFAYRDTAPYGAGYFGLRTTRSHLRVRNFSVTLLAS